MPTNKLKVAPSLKRLGTTAVNAALITFSSYRCKTHLFRSFIIGVHPPKPMMLIAYLPYFSKVLEFPPIFVLFRFLASPSLTMMHLFIMLYTCWAPLSFRPSFMFKAHFNRSPGTLIHSHRQCYEFISNYTQRDGRCFSWSTNSTTQ